jgi:hypothetical protein
MIPDLLESGLLPAGIHPAAVSEIQDRYATNAHRQRLFSGLLRAIVALRQAKCELIYLDGSFVTAKTYPADYDACWELKGVVPALLDPVFLNFGNRRAAQKAKFFGEFFPAHFQAEAVSPFRTFLNYFQKDSDTGVAKGIIAINLNKSV